VTRALAWRGAGRRPGTARAPAACVLRGLAHASLLFAVAHLPGGRRAYHAVTRGLFRSQERVARKLRRVWPGYAGVWRERCGLPLEESTVWVHEPGCVPFAPLASYLLTGRGGIVTAARDYPHDRYVGTAVRAALDAGFVTSAARRAHLGGLEGAGVEALFRATATRSALGCDPARLPVADAAADLCHSGGILEHYRPAVLAAFLRESFRIVRPGGIASHVYDHRDHLRHVDPGWPFLLHMSLPEPGYRALFGHPLLFHNRLSPREVMALFEAAGFQPIAVRRFVLPDKRYVDTSAAAAGDAGVPPWLGSGRLGALSTEDRHTAAIHYLYRRPGPC
jgi:SAM-dependent methyltransferase